MLKASRKFKRPSDVGLPVGVLDGSIPLSQSIITLALQCDKQFVMHLDRWEVPGRELNTFYGTCFHEMLDLWYSGRAEAEIIYDKLVDFITEGESSGEFDWLSIPERAYQETILMAVLNKYFETHISDLEYWKILEVEKKFTVPFAGVQLTGKRDGVVQIGKKKYLLEHKTKGEIKEDRIELKLAIDLQTQLYILAYYEEHGIWLDGVLYNVIRRPKVKPAYRESLGKFADRLEREIDRDRNYYFYRWFCEYSKDDRELFRFELEHKIKHIRDVVSGKLPVLRNEASCHGNYECPFLRACATNSFAGYRQRVHVSPELI